MRIIQSISLATAVFLFAAGSTSFINAQEKAPATPPGDKPAPNVQPAPTMVPERLALAPA